MEVVNLPFHQSSTHLDEAVYWRLHSHLPIDSPSFNTLDSSLNSSHHTVKFTTSHPSASVAFLDTLITLTDSGLTSDLYSKSIDSHHYLSPSSNHPKHIFYSIVYSGALRLCRNCSSDELFQTRLKEFLSYLLSSGYSSSFIKPILQKVASFDRLSLRKLPPLTDSPS